MHMTNKAKHWVMRHSLWIATGLFGLSLAASLTFASTWASQVKLTLIGIPFTFVFLIQKQKLEETRLFKELFQDFNSRYDKLNEALDTILTGQACVDVSPVERRVLYHYFNLCAEEYLFYRLGYIPDDVWCSWQNGMATFFDCPRIRKVWDDDPGADSYYGMTPPKRHLRVSTVGKFAVCEPSDKAA